MSFAPTALQFDSAAATVDRVEVLDAIAHAASQVHAVPALRGECTVELDLRHAGRRTVALRYEILGDRTLPAVFVAGGISAHRHLAASAAFAEQGWWEQQVGTGKALDPREQCLVAFDWLGADGTLDAPLDPSDQADAISALLDTLRIARLQAFVGCSYGAMVGLQFAARHGDRLGQLIAISGVHRAHPYASAWRALQRRAVALGALQCDETHGLALARQFAILSYRTPEEFAARFEAAQVSEGRVRVGAEDYLDHCGASYVQRTSPTAYLRLSESIDLQDVDPTTIRLPVTVVAVAEDRLVPLSDAYDLVERLRGETRLRVVRSLYGHDAFLKEEAEIGAILGEALDDVLEVAA
ncbi:MULTISPECIES: homoserine O-succinyltransferase [unclassified Lysobacter]|uniref:homoserine O-succinyltransferase MetX n=1 Tax=unclassified Lysobacter TaxID=2635362 RepID=UPI001C21E6A5|nr:homoserine O-succinyltransferase [Lysobacter sp. MMG2]MBU8976627.1 homoserine O-succinyltransferase [Lysobacter sp. MMG2]